MILYYIPFSKRESVEWRRPGEAPPRKAIVSQSAKKIMATIFGDCRGTRRRLQHQRTNFALFALNIASGANDVNCGTGDNCGIQSKGHRIDM
jgi:hypothetical protein